MFGDRQRVSGYTERNNFSELRFLILFFGEKNIRFFFPEPSKKLWVGWYLTAVMKHSKAMHPNPSEELYNVDLSRYRLFTRRNYRVSAHLCFFPPLVNRSDKPAELPSCSTLNDFQILCTLGDGEFSHVDLVSADL